MTRRCPIWPDDDGRQCVRESGHAGLCDTAQPTADHPFSKPNVTSSSLTCVDCGRPEYEHISTQLIPTDEFGL